MYRDLSIEAQAVSVVAVSNTDPLSRPGYEIDGDGRAEYLQEGRDGASR